MPVRTGMTKVGLPGAKEGWQEQDITIAAVLKEQGYVTGQFGKNHFGDRDEHLPTNHGFDEFIGYHSGNIDFISHVGDHNEHDWWHGRTETHGQTLLHKLGRPRL